MAGPSFKGRAARAPAVADNDLDIRAIAAMNVEALRRIWREKRGAVPPDALSKDLLARALAHWLQEERLGALEPRLRKLLSAIARNGSAPIRHLKVGSVIVREHDGMVHEVMVVPGGFCWQGQSYSSLSSIALKITGTSWSGPRFFGLRTDAEPTRAPAGSEVPAAAAPAIMAIDAKTKAAPVNDWRRSVRAIQAPIERSSSRIAIASSGERRS